MATPWKGKHINVFIWCVVGAAIGWIAGSMGTAGRSIRIETILVGVFGAVIGGEILASFLASAPEVAPVLAKVPSIPGVKAVVVDTPFSILGLLMAVVGAVVALAILGVMRKAVGPMRPSKKKNASGR